MVTERAAAEANNGRQTDRDVDNGSILPSSLGNLFLELDQNPPLPAGWEMCLDLQSGSIYFRDRTSGTCTYKDPRSCSSKKQATSPVLGNFFSGVTALSGPGFAIGYKHSRNRSVTLEEKLASWNNCRSYATTEDATILELSLKADYGVGATGWSTEEGSEESVAFENDGTRSLPVMCVDLSSLVEESSVCTVEKVKNALKRSHFRALSRNDSGCTNSSLSSLHTLSLNLPSPSSPCAQGLSLISILCILQLVLAFRHELPRGRNGRTERGG
ncbi:hypothetical protein R1flu_019622 [Riccia fluitans]|uniref:WW domain-containing protein n=1 Tax=Riccia fluitans TaxID=41844 RepID=A0ABD1ZJ71_9MARC